MPDDIIAIYDDPEYRRLEDLIWELVNNGSEVDLDSLVPPNRPDFRVPFERLIRRAVSAGPLATTIRLCHPAWGVTVWNRYSVVANLGRSGEATTRSSNARSQSRSLVPTARLLGKLS